MSNELLLALNEVFPTEGVTVPYIELKFRYGGKFGTDKLDELLFKLVEDDIMTSYEFGGSRNYKTLKDLPLKLGGKSSNQVNSSMTKDLNNLLIALATKIGDDQLIKMTQEFSQKYS